MFVIHTVTCVLVHGPSYVYCCNPVRLASHAKLTVTVTLKSASLCSSSASILASLTSRLAARTVLISLSLFLCSHSSSRLQADVGGEERGERRVGQIGKERGGWRGEGGEGERRAGQIGKGRRGGWRGRRERREEISE